jgi:hypothetical protein
VVSRGLADGALSDGSATVERSHRDVRTRFVRMNQMRRGDALDSLQVAASPIDDFRSVQLCCDESLSWFNRRWDDVCAPTLSVNAWGLAPIPRATILLR